MHVFVHKQDESMQDWSQGLYLLSLLILHTSCTELRVTKIRPKNNCWPRRRRKAFRLPRSLDSGHVWSGQVWCQGKEHTSCATRVQLLFTSHRWTLCDEELYTNCSPIHAVQEQNSGIHIVVACSVTSSVLKFILTPYNPWWKLGLNLKWGKVAMLYTSWNIDKHLYNKRLSY